MKILIWGTGHWAESFLLMSGIAEDQITGYVESGKGKLQYREKRVYAPDEVKELEYDVIIVASSYAEDIKKEMEKQQIGLEKAVFLAWDKIGVEEKVRDDAVNRNEDEIQYIYDWCGDAVQHKLWVSFVGGNGIYSNAKEVLEHRTAELDMSKYWKEKDVYIPTAEISEIAKHQIKFLEENFFPRITKEQIICDFACASGMWSEMAAPYVGHVDGYDCSEKMIESAKKNAVHKKIDNVSYAYMDAKALHFEREYDHFIMMGLLTCIDDELVVENIVRSVAENLKSGGYLVVRDTLNMTETNKIYYNNPAHGSYSAVYHAQKNYENIFVRNGFEIEREEYFQSYCHRPIEVGSHGYLFRKK